MLLSLFLSRVVRSGELTVIDFSGARTSFGRRDQYTPVDEQPVVIRLTGAMTAFKLGLNPGLNAGEAYMDGTLKIESGTIYDLLAIITRNMGIDVQGGPLDRWRHLWGPVLRRIQQMNSRARSRRNVAHHYDLSRELYRRFLDRDMQYSCAYFAHPDMTLEDAQTAKKRHIANKLLLRDGQRVLDIGSGWGGLALTLARQARVEVLGVTLSKEQLEFARQRAAEAGLSNRVRFELADYREIKGPFDRVVSVGMFEHVGIPNYGAYFGKIHDLLAPDGVALVHSIGRADGPGVTNPWIQKYIFPGGYSPALSETLPAIERTGMYVTDLEIWRLHYAETLRHWRQRFAAQRDEIAKLYDERFCRMFEFYLAGSECAFRYQGHIVFQAQLARAVSVVPSTRNYLYGDAKADADLARAS
jgi:cyclopropane-fatty-acyl-phospholipid synthase